MGAICDDDEMASWRSTTSAQAQADIDGLLQAVLPYAEQSLVAHGELPPLIASVLDDGDLQIHTDLPIPAEERYASNGSGFLSLYDHARLQSASQRAMALVNQGDSCDGTVAVHVAVEHAEGVALDYTARYRHHDFGEYLALDAIDSVPAQPRIWV